MSTATRPIHQLTPERHEFLFRRYLMAGGFSEGLHGGSSHLVPDASPDEQHALMGGNLTLGGALLPDGLAQLIMRDVGQRSAFLRAARTERDFVGDHLPIVAMVSATGDDAGIYPSGFKGEFRSSPITTGGTALAPQNQPTFEGQRIPVFDWWPDPIELARDLFEDAAGLDGALRTVFRDTFSVDVDRRCTTGNGIVSPLGLLTEHADFSITAINSGNANAATFDGLVNLLADLPPQYRASAQFMMNSVTFARLLKMKDAAGAPIFRDGKLFEKLILFNEFMPDIAANAFPIVFGDFSNYVVALRSDIRVLVFRERYYPNIALQPFARVGGQTVRRNGFRRLKVAA